MEKIRTLIVDDEPLAREGIWMLLKGDPEIEIIGECGDGREAAKIIEEYAPDLLFLDVQMPEVNGFDLLKIISAEHMPVIIFVTAYDQYALKAFDVHALDYLLKPYDDERFQKAIERAKIQIQQKKVNEFSQRLISMLDDYQTNQKPVDGFSASEKPDFLDRLVVKSAGRIYFLSVDEIDWIEAADYYSQLHVGSQSYMIRDTMKNLEKKLDPNIFMRIHRSTIVNINRIKELQAYHSGDYVVLLHDKTKLKLSRGRREAIEAILGQSL